MPTGGARNRSGPAPDPLSGRSDRRGFKLTALPSEGFRGEVPDFPLPAAVVIFEYFEDKQKVRELDQGASESRRDREQTLWEWAWTTPQACAWSLQPWRWHTVAMWVRVSALCESSDAQAADKNSLHRFADQIGLTPAGLKENGWAIAVNEVGAKRDEKDDAAPARVSSRSKLTVVKAASGGA